MYSVCLSVVATGSVCVGTLHQNKKWFFYSDERSYWSQKCTQHKEKDTIIRESTDALCRDDTGQILRNSPTKSLLTLRQ